MLHTLGSPRLDDDQRTYMLHIPTYKYAQFSSQYIHFSLLQPRQNHNVDATELLREISSLRNGYQSS